MAQIKRKRVSTEAARGQRNGYKDLLKKWWVWAIGIVAICGIALAIVLPITLSAKTNEKPDYFIEKQEYKLDDKTYGVNFEKMSYSGALQHIDSTNTMYEDYVFIFATDLSTFYPKSFYETTKSEDDLKNDVHESYFNLLIQLQYNIDKYNETHNQKCRLYIVDTTTSSYSENASILDDTTNFETSGESKPLFCFYKDDKLTKEFKATINGEYREDNNLYSYEDYNYSNFITIIRNALKYIENEFVDEEK